MKKIMSLSSGPPADETPQTSILTRMTKTVKYHIRQSFPYSVALFIVNSSPSDIAFYCFLIERGFPLFLIGKNANSDNI